jgi:hypothetical protein
MVYVLVLDVHYEGQSLLGVYSSLEAAQEAGRLFADGHSHWRDDACVAVEARELDGRARDAHLSEYVWEYRP